MGIEYIIEERRQRDEFLASHYASPLPEEHLAVFTGLAYFPPDPDWRLTGLFRAEPPRKVDIVSSAGTESPYTRLGTVQIEIDGLAHELVVLDDGDGNAFIPFRDLTCGVESYDGGRYVSVAVESDGSATVDFNLSRNPWCVYDEEFVCPLPPRENTIQSRVTAGEKRYDVG